MGGALPGGQQRRPHGGPPDGGELRVAPHPVGDPHPGRDERDRQRRRRRSGGAAHRVARPRRARRGHRTPAHLGRRASADAVPRRDRQGRRAVRRQQEDRHHRPRYRPVLPGQDRAAGHPRRDVLDPAALAEKIEGALEFKNQVLVKIYNRKALDAGEVVENLLAQAEASGIASPTPGCCWAPRSSAGRRSCWRARRARCSTSTTARIPL